MRKKQRTRVNNLPLVLQHSVLSYLEPRDVCATRQVCRALRNCTASWPCIATTELEILTKLCNPAFVRDVHLHEETTAALTHIKAFCHKVQFIDFEEQQATNSMLEIIGGMQSVQRLHAWHCDLITDAGLVHLSRLTNLRWLDFDCSSNITTAGIAHLASLQNLESLNLSCCNLITGLQSLPSNLKRLSLAHCTQITDAEFVRLIPKLELLILHGCVQMTDAGIAHITKLSSLTTLDLGWCTSLTDAALEHVATLTNLNELHLSGCTQLEKSEPLHQLKCLQRLDVAKCTGFAPFCVGPASAQLIRVLTSPRQ